METNNAIGSIITLVIGVGIAVLLLILIGSLSGSTVEIVQDDLGEIGQVVSATQVVVAMNNVTAQSMGKRYIVSVSKVANATNNRQILLGNFTFNYEAGTMLLVNTKKGFHGFNAEVNYTYHNETIRQSVENSIIGTFNALDTTGQYLPIIVLAVVIALVLGIVLSFGLRGRSGGGMAL